MAALVKGKNQIERILGRLTFAMRINLKNDFRKKLTDQLPPFWHRSLFEFAISSILIALPVANW